MRLLLLAIAILLQTAPLAQVTDAAIASHPAAPALARGQAKGQEVSIPYRGKRLRAVLYQPDGKGRHPAILWNHGADKSANAEPELARFYTSHGYAFFVPMRPGHGGSDGQTVDERLAPAQAANFSDPAASSGSTHLLRYMRWKL